jgi:2-polyprenyl-6-methoxyphenol hydroxylase-like FAD-dependent oxidoreductase
MAEGAGMALEDGLVLAECLASGDGVAKAVAGFQARRRPRTRWVLAQTRRRDRTRNLPTLLRDFVLRRWGRKIVHANYRPLLDLP